MDDSRRTRRIIVLMSGMRNAAVSGLARVWICLIVSFVCLSVALSGWLCLVVRTQLEPH